MANPNMVLDNNWWKAFKKSSDNVKYDFFNGEYPMDIKKAAMESLIWTNDISTQLVINFVPNIVDINFYDHFDHLVRPLSIVVRGIDFEFRYDYDHITEDTIEYLLEIYPLTNNSQQAIKNLCEKKISLEKLTKIIRNQLISLSLDTFKRCITRIQIGDNEDVTKFLDFVTVCLENSNWRSREEINMAFESTFCVDYYIQEDGMWRRLCQIFMEYGYDPFYHEIDKKYYGDIMNQCCLLTYLLEIMDVNVIAKNFIGRVVEDTDRDVDQYTTMRSLQILAIHGADLNTIFAQLRR